MTDQTFAPYQQRVIDEKRDLDIKVKALNRFISEDPVFEALSAIEQFHLRKQWKLMSEYSEVLGERIAIFTTRISNRETNMTDRNIEQEIQAKGLTAPRITPADIEANIASEHYFTAAAGVEGELRFGDPTESDSDTYPDSLKLLTFCVLVLQNGFTVTGESACASPENFDAEIGRKIARQNAINKVWPLMGYELRSKLAVGDNGVSL